MVTEKSLALNSSTNFFYTVWCEQWIREMQKAEVLLTVPMASESKLGQHLHLVCTTVCCSTLLTSTVTSFPSYSELDAPRQRSRPR